MNDAVDLFLQTPGWYLSAWGTLFQGDSLLFGLGTGAGAIGLLLGVALGIRRREARLLWFLLSPTLSQVYLVVAGLFRGQLSGGPLALVFGIFMAAQLVLLSVLLFRLCGARLPGAALSVFGISYALFAAFVAGMSFADDWL